MNLRTNLLTAAIAASFMMLAPAAFAQTSTTHPQAPEEAPAAPGAPNATGVENQAQTLALRIEKARRDGKDVTKAETEEKQGEAALRAGYKSEATQHFKRAQQDLANQ